MEQPLLTIGAFARAVGLAPGTLRYYDECGLLRPAEVDETTGYRYYTPELARRAQLVVRMRDAGMSVVAMRAALDGTAEERQQLLRDLLAEQRATAARRAAVLEDLLADRADGATTASVTIDGPQLAAAIRQVRVAADPDPTSPLSGVLIDIALETIDVVATNRFWMAIRTLPASPADDVRAVVSLPSATRLAARLDGYETATVDLGEAVMVAGTAIPIQDVAYPAHRMLLAGLAPATTRVVLSRDEVVAAIEAVGHAELDLEVTPSRVRVGDREITATVDGPPATLRLGSALATRALTCALGPEIVLHLASETSPVRVGSPYQPGFLALLMPIAPTGR